MTSMVTVVIMGDRLVIDDRSREPSYVQLAAQLRERIRDGRIGPGDALPSITQLTGETGLSVQTVRRGILISFAAAAVQGFTAIALVLIATILLRVTAVGMTRATDWFEIASYALIVLVGAWLLWSKATGRGHGHDHGG